VATDRRLSPSAPLRVRAGAFIIAWLAIAGIPPFSGFFAKDEIIFREGDPKHEFFLLRTGRVALEMAVQDKTLRVHVVEGGDELGWSAVLMGGGKRFQARALEPVDALAFDGYKLLDICRADNAFGYKIMHRMLGVVSERLQAARLQVLDKYSPIAKKAGA